MNGDEFLRWRKLAGLTQAQAAEKFDVRELTINRWERGKSPVPAGVAVQLGEAAVAEELGPGIVVRASDLLPKPEAPVTELPVPEVEYVWMGGQRVALPPGMKPTTAKEYAQSYARHDLKTGKRLDVLRGPYKGGPVPRGCQVVRICRQLTEPKAQPWARGKAEA